MKNKAFTMTVAKQTDRQKKFIFEAIDGWLLDGTLQQNGIQYGKVVGFTGLKLNNIYQRLPGSGDMNT